jgi:hypothetical protein
MTLTSIRKKEKKRKKKKKSSSANNGSSRYDTAVAADATCADKHSWQTPGLPASVLALFFKKISCLSPVLTTVRKK